MNALCAFAFYQKAADFINGERLCGNAQSE
jgi:hypothetical protein